MSSAREHDGFEAVATFGKAASASTDAAKEVASTATEIARAAKSFASWTKAKIRGGDAAPENKGSPSYDEEHPGPPESH